MEKAITCIKPSDGGLHLGHWIGNIQPLIAHQYEYECIFIFADLQASNIDNKHTLKENVTLMLKQILSLGVNPKRVQFYLESQLKRDKLEDFILLSNYVSNTRINRIPVIKRKTTPIKMSMYLFPILQMLDFYLTGASIAFSNIDNKSAIELTNEVFKRINRDLGFQLKHIDLIHGTVNLLVGFDNQKMSKEKNNCIFFNDSFEKIRIKVNKMYTDPSRIHSNIPGNINNNVVFKYFQAFLEDIDYNECVKQYQQGALSDTTIKQMLTEKLWEVVEKCQKNMETIDCTDILESMGFN